MRRIRRTDRRIYEADAAPVSHRERSLRIQLDHVISLELRPTRLLIWWGEPGEIPDRVLALGGNPRLLRLPRRRRHLNLGAVHVSFLGNPLFTLLLPAVRVFRSLLVRRRSQAP